MAPKEAGRGGSRSRGGDLAAASRLLALLSEAEGSSKTCVVKVDREQKKN